MTLQEIFNKVAVHLLTQNEPARSTDPHRSGSCMYKAQDGKKCAVGCLIADSAYTPSLEFKPIDNPLFVKAFADSGFDIIPSSSFSASNEAHNLFYVLRALQAMHDDRPVSEWKTRLENIASSFSLSYDVLKDFN